MTFETVLSKNIKLLSYIATSFSFTDIHQTEFWYWTKVKAKYVFY